MKNACLAALLLSTLLAATAQAGPSIPVHTAESVRATGGIDSDSLQLWHSTGDPSAPQAGISFLELLAATVRIQQYEDHAYVVGRYGNQQVFDKQEPANSPSIDKTLHGAVLALENADPGFIANLLSTGASLDGQATSTSTTIRDPVMTKAGISAALTQDPESSHSHFRVKPLQGDFVLTSVGTGTAGFTIVGDFVLELLGIDLVEEDGSPVVYESGEETTAVGPDPAPGTFTPAAEQETVVLILTVKGGRLTVESEGPRFQWVTSSAGHSLTSGEAHFYGAIGHDGVRSSRAPVAAPLSFEARPSGEVLEIVPREDPGASGSVVREVPRASAAIVGSLAGLGAVASGLYFAWRRRQPTLPIIEAEIQAGHHSKAARMAGRLLRRHPGQEDALLARSIALSKGGRHERVVREISAHLRSKDPTDGSLHYVLGLAHMDLGHVPQARQAFTEAVRRTPSLLPEIAPRLGADPPALADSAAPSPTPSPSPSPSGYA